MASQLGYTAKLQIEFHKKLPALMAPPTDLLLLIFRTGAAPATLRRIYLAPLAKPGKDPHRGESRRPIALPATTIKITEYAIYHRILRGVGPQLSPHQYAYRRDRGTEMCLAEAMDLVHRSLSGSRWC